jgi:hypothetical protein
MLRFHLSAVPILGFWVSFGSSVFVFLSLARASISWRAPSVKRANCSGVLPAKALCGPEVGRITRRDRLGGLIHEYRRAA